MSTGKKSQDTAKAKGKFLADMSHEIQNSMKIILSRSDLLKQTDLSHKQIEYLDVIYESAQKLSWIINDILDFSQMEMGIVNLQSVDFNLKYLISDIFKKIVKQRKDHPVDTYIDIDKNVPHDLIGDPTRLRQVLVNLLSNAFKFTLEGEIGIIVRKVDNTAKKDDVHLQIIVKDSGKGISEEQLGSIFELQSQGDPSKSWEYGGTGLGLAICKLVVDAMGGTITATSTEGKGSQFEINLSFKQGAKSRVQDVHPLSRDELVGKRAIIVDDNEIARKILKKCCEMMGIEPILISASPKAVLQMLNDLSKDEEAPDLILCDIMMPEMDGYQLIKKIRAEDKYRDIKAIAVTQVVHVGSAQNAQESGFDGFLPKPVFLDELARVITTVLGDERENKTIVTRHMAKEISFKETKILVIEDMGVDQKLLKECLGMMECEKEFVSTSHEAIECFSERVYDVCLIDFLIYKREGADIVKTIKKVSQNIPVVALLTADAEKDHRAECLGAGIDDFLVKPVDMISLKRIVKRYGKN
jgi:CheY-like chemotaxis protein